MVCIRHCFFDTIVFFVLGFVDQRVYGFVGCGFPGRPAHGSIIPTKDHYLINETVEFNCKDKYGLDGNKTNQCNDDNKWMHPPTELPRCLKEVKHEKTAHWSSMLSPFSDASVIVDDNSQTCTASIKGDENYYWVILLNGYQVISKIIIEASFETPNTHVEITVMVRSNIDKRIVENVCFSQTLVDLDVRPQIVGYCTQVIAGDAIKIYNNKRSDGTYGSLNLCEVKIFQMTDILKCGKPDIPPFCEVEKVPSTTDSRVKYTGKEGYEAEGPDVRTCVDGKWSGVAPICKRKEGFTPSSMSDLIKSMIAVAVVVVLALLVIASVCFRRSYLDKKERRSLYQLEKDLFAKGAMERFNPILPWEDQIELLPYDQHWEFPRERLLLGKTIGQGAFGRVVQADAQKIIEGQKTTTVAVKMLKSHASKEQRKALMQELKIMSHLGRHVNILNLLGACTKNCLKGEMLIIMEFCHFGNLCNYLLRNRHSFIDQINPETGERNINLCGTVASMKSDVRSSAASTTTGTDDYLVPIESENMDSSYVLPNITESSSNSKGNGLPKSTNNGTNEPNILSTSDLVCYSLQIAIGMEYLSSRKLVHRDLAARNILVAENNIIKICDFGLTKDTYQKAYYRKKGDAPLPIKWMAIESIRDRLFSTASDVWSFGVVVWEIFTLGSTPYPGLELDEYFYKRLIAGYRMDKPEFAPDKLNDIIISCWNADPEERPIFSKLVEQIGNLMEPEDKKKYIDLNDTYLKLWKLSAAKNEYVTLINEPYSEYTNVSNTPIEAEHGDSEDLAQLPDYLDMRSAFTGNCSLEVLRKSEQITPV